MAFVSHSDVYRAWRRRHALTRRDAAWLAGAWCGLIALMLVQQLLGPYVSLDLLYALPIALAAWNRGRGVTSFIVYEAVGVRTGALVLHRGSAGEALWVGREAVVIVNYFSALVIFVLVAWGVRALRASMDRERLQARQDALTGLLNRRAFLERAELERARLARSGSVLALAFLDLDGFKAINDTMGHEAGDAVLQRVARTLASGTRATDAVGRMGGDEFAILLPDTTARDAHELLLKLERAVSAAAEGSPTVGVSWGLAVIDSPGIGVLAMLDSADRAMYSRKNARRDTASGSALQTSLFTP
jgi:diguanylate cyclase (GGDEF)-like protein